MALVRLRLVRLGTLLLVASLAAGCPRDELEQVCTPVAPGQLVVSELRGLQTGVDTWGQWIEIYNTSDTAVNVGGLRLSLQRLDGTGGRTITVRDLELAIDARGYLVLGRFEAWDRPAHVDYGYASDLDADLYEDGILELRVCNQPIDTVIYRGLPETGSLAFDGAATLSAAANDIESHWCVDASDVGGHPTEVGIPGTPGEMNRPCN